MKAIPRMGGPSLSSLRGGFGLLTVCLLMAACVAGGGEPTAEETPTEPSPTATSINGQIVPLEDVEAIEQAVRGYFEALGAGDLGGAKLYGKGDAMALVKWQSKMRDRVGPGGLRPAAATVDSLQIVSVEGDTATVEIEGRLDESLFDPPGTESELVGTSLDGPVRVVRKTAGWVVADYARDGELVARQVHTVQGQQAESGVVIRIVGLDVRKQGAAVIAEIRNSSGLRADGERGRVVTASGKVLTSNFPERFIEVQMTPRSKATVGFWFPKGHGIKGRQFRFLIDFFVGCDPACDATPQFDFPVRVSK